MGEPPFIADRQGMAGEPGQDEIFRQIRANVAFEHMVVAVLAGAAISGAGLFLIVNGAYFLGGGWSGGVFLDALMGALWFAFLIFLVGFAAAVAVGAPLFVALERAKYRRFWPYLTAAVIVEIVVYGLIQGRIPEIGAPAALLFLLPGVIIAFLFRRRIRPLWLAAERADTAPTVWRIH